MEILKDKLVKARKSHICFFCGQKISKGEIYNYHVNTSDGLVVIKLHKDCKEISIKLDMYDHCDEGLTPDLFWDSIGEAYREMIGYSLGEYTEADEISLEEQLKEVCDYYQKERS